MANIVFGSRIVDFIELQTISYHTMADYCIAARKKTSGLVKSNSVKFEIKYDISQGYYNIYIKMNVNNFASRFICYLYDRTEGANELICTEENDETNFKNAQYTCAIQDDYETTLNNALTKYPQIITEKKATSSFDVIKINLPNTMNVNFIVSINGTTGTYFYTALFQTYNQGGSQRCHFTELQKGSIFGEINKNNEGYILIPVTQPASSQNISVNILNLSNSGDITIEFINSSSLQSLE